MGNKKSIYHSFEANIPDGHKIMKMTAELIEIYGIPSNNICDSSIFILYLAQELHLMSLGFINYELKGITQKFNLHIYFQSANQKYFPDFFLAICDTLGEICCTNWVFSVIDSITDCLKNVGR